MFQVLGVDQRVTIHDLAVTHSAIAAEELARSVLRVYVEEVSC